MKLKSFLACMTLIWLAFGAYLIFGGPVIPHFILDQLKPGMTNQEVIEILGEPVTKHDQEWEYDRWGNPGWVEIEFDDEGEFVGINDESP